MRICLPVWLITQPRSRPATDPSPIFSRAASTRSTDGPPGAHAARMASSPAAASIDVEDRKWPFPAALAAAGRKRHL